MKMTHPLHTLSIRRLVALVSIMTALESATGVAATATSVTEGGITWSFDKDYTIGQFTNGEWWVLDPGSGVTINAITRPAKLPGRDGSTLDPSGRDTHWGWDDRCLYAPSANWANDLPKTISTTGAIRSLVSVISFNPQGDDRPVVKECRVLTVVPEVPPPNSFRPCYAGGTAVKKYYSTGAISLTAFPKVAAPTGTPTASDLNNIIGPSVWLDVAPTWKGEYFHPYDALNITARGNSARYYAAQYGSSLARYTLALCTDQFTDEQRRQYLIKLIQIGIDFHGNVQSGSAWGEIGGTMGTGRRLPIMIAGLVLGDDSMLNITATAPADFRTIFQEDSQPFYLTQAAKDATRQGVEPTRAVGCWDSLPITGFGGPNVNARWNSRGGPNGYPVWGERYHAWKLGCGWCYLPGKATGADGPWDQDYMPISYEACVGQAAVAILLGIRDNWNNEVFFDWVDERFDHNQSGTHGYPFNKSMYGLYRTAQTNPFRRPSAPNLVHIAEP